MHFGDVGLWLLVALSASTLVGVAPRLRTDVITATLGASLVALLAWQFLTEDWSSVYVADHTRVGVNPFLRTAGLWAGAEGSLLLWTSMVGVAAVIATRLSTPAGRVAARRLGAGLTLGYGLVVVLTASPFQRLDLPANGGLGLQPVLEHPAMVWHPPLLYAGLVGLLVPSIGAAASGLTGSEPVVSARSLRTPQAILTVGLVTGAIWANVELGWGGFWAWDPIESAGLVAWLCGAAAVHAGSRPARSVGGRRIGVALLVAPGFAAIGATTVTRIGVVASVHAFADRPALRIGLLVVAALAGVVVARAIVGAGSGGQSQRSASPLASDRRAAMAVLAVGALFVAVGTYEPVIEAATTGDRLGIAGHYYTRLLWPLVIVGAALAIRADRSWWPSVLGAMVAVGVVPFGAGPFALILAGAGGAVVGAALAASRRRGRAGAVAHAGVGLALVGVAGTVATTVSLVNAPVDEPVIVDGIEIVHRSIELQSGIDTRQAVATVEIDGAVLTPALTTFDLRGVSTAEIDRRRSGLDEIQVVLLDGDGEQAQYRVNRLPRLMLVWAGAVVVAVGLAAQPRRRLRASNSETVDAGSSDGADGSTVSGSVCEAVESAAGALSGGDVGGDDSPG